MWTVRRSSAGYSDMHGNSIRECVGIKATGPDPSESVY